MRAYGEEYAGVILVALAIIIVVLLLLDVFLGIPQGPDLSSVFDKRTMVSCSTDKKGDTSCNTTYEVRVFINDGYHWGSVSLSNYISIKVKDKVQVWYRIGRFTHWTWITKIAR